MINELVNEVADLIDTAYKTAGQQPPVISHSRIEAALRRQGLHFHSEAIERFAEIAPAGPDGQRPAGWTRPSR